MKEFGSISCGNPPSPRLPDNNWKSEFRIQSISLWFWGLGWVGGDWCWKGGLKAEEDVEGRVAKRLVGCCCWLEETRDFFLDESDCVSSPVWRWKLLTCRLIAEPDLRIRACHLRWRLTRKSRVRFAFSNDWPSSSRARKQRFK